MASIERLLVVDDEELNRDMLSRRLVRNGFEVKVAENGSDALAQIERREVDLVLLDAMMPGMNGLEVLKQVRATHSPEDLPVIMVTAVSESLRVAEALDLGANDYVTKPIDFAVALARIRSQLSRKSAHARQQTSDPLTGLPNRRLFHERVQAALDRVAPGEGIGPAVLLLDMDRFKLINESLGYAAGDALLGQAAERLERTLLQGGAANLPGRMAARWSGGEFAVLLEGAADTEAVARVVEEFLAAMRQPYLISGKSIFCLTSIGAAIADSGRRSSAELEREADTALYAAKTRGRSCWALFEPSMRERAIGRLDIENELRLAIERDQFMVFYQPRVDLATGRMVGCEALVRWKHPERGVIGPDVFIPVAEETGLIRELGGMVLRRACLQFKQWQEAFPQQPPLGVAVNVSAVQCRGPEFAGEVAAALAESGLAPSSLHLEITESVLLEDLEEARQVLGRLKELGVVLKLDDFGTGYSSLKYLSQLPFDMLKIDRSFTMALNGSGKADGLVRSILGMAHDMEMQVVAEGVETVEHAMQLKEMGCEFGQGYLYSRPLPAADMEGLLRDGMRLDRGV